MSEPKPMAALTANLLARKGAARPAMRSQILPYQHQHDAVPPGDSAEWQDLGWNDFDGEDAAPAAVSQAEVVAISAEPEPVAAAPAERVVLAQQEAIAARIAPAVAPAPRRRAAAESRPSALLDGRRSALLDGRRSAFLDGRRSALADGRRAAFTLRLDAERHLKLRLACTLGHRSAQQLVTEAVDRLLDEMPDLSPLASQLRAGQVLT